MTLSVTKKPGENAVDVTARLRARIAELRNTLIPEGVGVEISRDYGVTANEKALKLIEKLVFATACVVALVFFAMGRREAAIVGIAVALTLTATLFASWAWGFTLNRVSLFALIFSIGILVDDAIVVVENIHRHLQLTPERSLNEIIPQAVDEVGGPTILATLTVIAALLPMAFVSGLMGPYMGPDSDQCVDGHADLARRRIHLDALARSAVVEARCQGRALQLVCAAGAAIPPTVFAVSRRRGRTAKSPATVGGRGRDDLLAVALPAIQWVVLKMLPFDNKSEFQVVVDMPAGTPVGTHGRDTC